MPFIYTLRDEIVNTDHIVAIFLHMNIKDKDGLRAEIVAKHPDGSLRYLHIHEIEEGMNVVHVKRWAEKLVADLFNALKKGESVAIEDLL